MEEAPMPEKIRPTLREATEADIDKLIELEQSVDTGNTYSAMTNADEWKEQFKLGPVYLIQKDGEVVGNMSYENKGDDHIYISGIVLDPKFQGQGIAREVLTDLLEKFKEMKRIDLVTHPENEGALRLYQSLGFKVEKRVENYFDDGQPRLVLALTKE